MVELSPRRHELKKILFDRRDISCQVEKCLVNE